MSTAKHVVRRNDTFASISRQYFGTEDNASLIAKSNPGQSEPLTLGSVVLVPGVVDNFSLIDPGREDLVLTLGGQAFIGWSSISIKRSFVGLSTVTLSTPLEVNNPVFRRLFKPFSYTSVVVSAGNEKLFTGVMIKLTPSVNENSKTLSVQCYSTPGVLVDCPMPASSFPLEYDGLNLRDIIPDVCDNFGVSVNFQSETGDSFDRVALEPTDKIFPWMVELTKQRQLLLRDDPQGRLVVHDGSISEVVATLEEGTAPLVSVTPNFNEQGFYSSVTGISPFYYGDSPQYTEKNPFLDNMNRPFTFQPKDGETNTIRTSVRAKVSRMLASAVSYQITVSTWRNQNGALWVPGQQIEVLAPSAFIFSKYKFMIKDVIFNRTDSRETATFSVVLPGVYTLELPGSLPWD